MVRTASRRDAEPVKSGDERRRPMEPGGILWDDAGLVTFPLTTGSAFLLQVMHPSIGAVVGERSVFRTDAVGRAARSVASVMTWIYGGEEALAEGDRLRAMHAPLKSVDEHGVTHHALTSGPWAWVMLTAPYSFLIAGEYFARRSPTGAECEALYGELVQVMRNLHVPEKEIAATYEEYRVTFDEIIDQVLVAHRTAWEYLRTVRHVPPPPGMPGLLRPLWRVLMDLPGRLQYFVTIGTLPGKAREKLGIAWTAADERRLRRFGRAIAYLLPVLPERLRYLPIAYEARRAERARRRLHAVLARRPR
ncbi:Uncharacterized conserved protein, DUF2236 family [Haloechinothrix alba]|uniref:Uncharacterized conserved protein, DUF2236 family n=1 Tax=Haloechinothrix alba TaxID=664784 RepID=A0A238WT14_9PSEU|nr:oxygenase MpaB family protein [Haloechinothrix alba]SNR49493.1 Uncharacterized conserved protein, DUF2236 family [Haloechinothrix alba]